MLNNVGKGWLTERPWLLDLRAGLESDDDRVDGSGGRSGLGIRAFAPVWVFRRGREGRLSRGGSGDAEDDGLEDPDSNREGQ